MDAQLNIPVIIDRHVEDAAFLWLLRDAAVKEPHYDLNDLAELDNRLAAHLDGLLVAGEAGLEVAEAALSIGEPGEVFVAAWLAVAALDGKKLDQVIDVTKGDHANYRALISALAWHPNHVVSGWVNSFLNANDPAYLGLGIRTCALHRIDPGTSLSLALKQPDENPVARSLRAIGELGRVDLLAEINSFRNSPIESHNFWSNWSSLLLGDASALGPIKFHVINNTPFAARAMQLVARTMGAEELKNLLQSLAQNQDTIRLAMLGAGISGDPFWIPGLITHMENPDLARVAGEALSMITGLDLAYLDLDSDRPEGFASGPTEDPSDEDVAMDADEDLPWPNPALLTQWWHDNASAFQAGARYLCGKPVSEVQCAEVLRKGFQRQRSASAVELALMGKPFYETRAPGFRQKQELITS